MSTINQEQMEYLISVGDLKSFSAAAEACYNSASAISRQISKLEEEFGVQLVVRGTRGVTLTRAGERTVETCRHILALISELHQACDWEQLPANKLRIGILEGLDFQPELIAALDRAGVSGQKAQVVISSHVNYQLLDLLERGEIDAAFTLDRDMEGSGASVYPMWRDKAALAVARWHVLARRKSTEGYDFGGETFLLVACKDSARYKNMLRDWFGALPEQMQEVGNIDTLIASVESGLGIALVPDQVYWRQNQLVQLLPVPDEDAISFQTVTAWKRENCRPVLRSFLKSLKEQFHGGAQT